MRFRLEQTYNPSKAWAIRAERALSQVNVAELKAAIVNRVLSRVNDIPMRELTPFLRKAGGWSVLIRDEIGAAPAHTTNQLGFVNEDAWYLWKHLNEQILELRFTIVSTYAHQHKATA